MLNYRPQPIITTLTRLMLLSNDELREEAERRGDTLALVICQRLEDAEEEFDISAELKQMEDDHDATCAGYESVLAELEYNVAEFGKEVRRLEEELAVAETRLALLKKEDPYA